VTASGSSPGTEPDAAVGAVGDAGGADAAAVRRRAGTEPSGQAGTPGARLVPAPPEPVAPADWSPRDLARLAAVFETFVTGAAIRRATMAASLLSRVADPADARALRLALRALDSRAANALLRQGAVRFRDLPPERREALLLSWATSRIGQRRTAFQTLKRLACFLAYADPGPAAAVNPFWARIGYQPVAEPVTPIAPAVRPLELPAGRGPVVFDADVAIVGSGAGGGVVAAALAGSGRDVLVVEAGAYVPETAMSPGELAGLDGMYLDHGLTATSDLGIAILAGSTLGGGTVVNWATCFAPPDWLRTEWAAGPGLEGFDGPETAADVAALRSELGFAPPPGIPPKDDVILQGASALGWDAAPLERDADGCGDCGACGFGCRRGTKRSGPRAHLAEAAERGARFLVRAHADRLLVEGGAAVGVAGRAERGDGSTVPFTVRARQIVVSAGTLRTPGLLAASGLEHPAIGANLRLHPVAAVAGRMPWPVQMWRGTMQAASCNRFVRPGPADGHVRAPAHGGFIVESAPAHPGLIALAFPWWGASDHAVRMTRVRSYAPLIGIVRDTGSGQVRTSRSGHVRIDYSIGGADALTARRALVEMARLARAAGALEVVALGTPGAIAGSGPEVSSNTWDAYLRRLATFDFRPNRGFLFSAHQMGTARAGSNPRTSACDPWGRVRSDTTGGIVRGLYVADASLFPTASGVNPMVTVMVLARRVARTILAEG
jgi:choline dehydrogenase-like flavoprotein